MVLESLINPFTAKKHPWEMFFVGFLYNSIAIFLSLWVFEEYASLVMVFLTVMACVPFIYKTIKIEEEIDLKIKKEFVLMKEHSKVLIFLIFLFLGIMLSVAVWYVVFPSSIHQTLFNIQTDTIEKINNPLTGKAIGSFNLFLRIFSNNMKVLMFCLLFAFFYGAGAIFILTWNASVIGVAIGNLIKTNIAKITNYFSVFPLAVLRYMTHGVFEISAYFAAGLAGGIISIAVIKHEGGTKQFRKVLVNSFDMILIAILLLFVAALVEVFITPILF
ncbi:hypothetical protein CEE44_02590 [Candidatus Woesearchaeota archaeon B3_Woes]|nr:MAG: hypothetical protein CEE44_02590 [Candidatus Woesearchaeota archaeon B3_Woes]